MINYVTNKIFLLVVAILTFVAMIIVTRSVLSDFSIKTIVVFSVVYYINNLFFSYASFVMGVNLPHTTTRHFRRNVGNIDISKLTGIIK